MNSDSVVLTENCARLVLKTADVLPQYLKCVLATDFLQKQIQLDSVQTTISKLSLDRIKRLKIPIIPSLDIQNRIINDYQSALAAKKAKEAEAKRLLASIDGLVLARLGLEPPPPEDAALARRLFYADSSQLSGGRFDADALNPIRLQSVNAVLSGKFPTEKLRHVAAFVKVQTDTKNANQRYIGLENIAANEGFYQPTNEVEEFGTANVFKRGQVLFPKLRPYLNKVYQAGFDGVCSTEFHVLDGKKVTNEFLAVFLRTGVVVAQTKRLQTGNTLPRLQTKDVEDLLIPVPLLEIQEEIAAEVAALYARAQRLRAEGRAMLQRAKAETERLILGAA